RDAFQYHSALRSNFPNPQRASEPKIRQSSCLLPVRAQKTSMSVIPNSLQLGNYHEHAVSRERRRKKEKGGRKIGSVQGGFLSWCESRGREEGGSPFFLSHFPFSFSCRPQRTLSVEEVLGPLSLQPGSFPSSPQHLLPVNTGG
ncbi:hypothetical protein KUCAC02_017849, partial [Chaenocephalus aceratus]